MFGAVATADAAPAVDVKTLHGKIGELTLENDFLSGALGSEPVNTIGSREQANGLLPSAKR